MSDLVWTPCVGEHRDELGTWPTPEHAIYKGWILSAWPEGGVRYCASPLDGLRDDLPGRHPHCTGDGITTCFPAEDLYDLLQWCDQQGQLAAQDAIPMTMIPRPR